MRKLIPVLILIVLALIVSVAFASGANPSFSFSTDEPGATFTCKLDNGTTSSCSSPKNYTGLAPGAHKLTIIESFTVPTVAAPTAAFTVTPSSPVTGQPVTFDGTGSTCTAAPCSYKYIDTADGSTLGTTQTSSFTFQGVGTKFVQLTVTDANGKTGTVSHSITVGSLSPPPPPPPPPPPGGSTVGTGGAPAPSCTTTVAVNSDVATAVSNAATGSTVCLASRTWSTIGLGASSNAVTLTAATPGAAVVNGLHLQGPVSNLTVEGLTLTDGIFATSTASNVTLAYNTLENWAASDAQSDPAFFTYTSGLAIKYNQIDHVPQCLQDDSSGGNTFSHNVCGPGIGNGGSPDVHYTQSDGVSNETISNNAFEGPLAANAGGHINVSHMAGGNDRFDGNILWHVGGVQHIQWNDDFASTNLEASNNLDVEDPSETTGAFEQIANNFSLAGFTNNNNTVIGANGETASDYTVEGSPSSCTVSNNIGVGNPGGSFAVSGSCVTTGNVTAVASWQATSWTPVSGSPWTPPPAGYYQPSGGSSAGYQDSIGP